MKLTRQQRLGLLLTGILMVLAALLFALIKPPAAASVASEPPAPSPDSVTHANSKPSAPAPPPPTRNHLDDEF